MKAKRKELSLEDVQAFYKLVSESQIGTKMVNREVEYLESLLCDLLFEYEKNPPDGKSEF